MKTLSFFGCGHVGRTLGRLWAQSGTFAIGEILARSAGSAEEAARFIGAGRPVQSAAALQPADVFLIATGDDAIAGAAATLADAGILGPGSIVFHCSGAQSSAVLAPCAARGAAIAAVHPIRSFAAPDTVVARFAGTWCGAEGDAAALSVLEPAFAAIGAKTARIDAGARTLYHAAAVFASNYTTTLLALARDAYGAAGVPPDVALQMMEPLVREGIENVFRLGPERALSGPVARGDTATVARQQEAVSAWDADAGAVYRQMAEATRRLAARRKA